MAHALLGLRARAEEGICRGQMRKCRNAGCTAEDDPVLGTPRLQREEQHLVEGCPKKPPEGDTIRTGPTWGYGAKLVQGKYVSFALNTLANILTMLMRQDVWTGWLRSAQLTKSKEGQLMGQVLK